VTGRQRWTPALVLGLGTLLLQTIGRQGATPLLAPLDTLPREIAGYVGHDRTLGQEQVRVGGMSSYLSRVFGPDSLPAFAIYVGHYEYQTQGRTIHSPKNCLPGAGWEPLESGYRTLVTPLGKAEVNRYLIANKSQFALVYYWYQGRGRVSANEYQVKFELMRDAALRGRTDEALARVLVPVRGEEGLAAAEELAEEVARTLVVALDRVLPR
jgi:EpsI family protein